MALVGVSPKGMDVPPNRNNHLPTFATKSIKEYIIPLVWLNANKSFGLHCFCNVYSQLLVV